MPDLQPGAVAAYLSQGLAAPVAIRKLRQTFPGASRETWLVDAEASPRAGGILADDMGLGKTLQMLCLSVRDTGEGADSDDEASSSASAEAEAGTATLVVCPLALMRNWIKEGAWGNSVCLFVWLFLFCLFVFFFFFGL